MEDISVIDIIECVCTVVSLILSIFAVASVVNIKKENNSSKQIGKTNIKADHSTVLNGSNNSLHVVDEKIPEIKHDIYYFNMNQEGRCTPYFCNVKEDTLQITTQSKEIIMKIDFTGTIVNPIETMFAGYCIKALPMNDWRGFIKENYILEFDYIADFSGEFQLEIGKNKMYQLPISFKEYCRNSHKVILKNYLSTIDMWKSVGELCFVFFPKKCGYVNGSIQIFNIRIIRGDL